MSESRDPAPGRSVARHREMLALCLLAVAASFLLVNGSDGRVHLPWALDALAPSGLPASCPSVAIFGASCPGCGMSRSFIATSRLRLGEAFAFNAAGPFLFLLAFFQVPYRLYRIRTRSPAAWTTSPRLRLTPYPVIALMIGAWIWEVCHVGLSHTG